MVVKRRKRTGVWFLFWLAFFLGVTLLFVLNLEKIKNTLQKTGVLEELTKNDKAETEETLPELNLQDLINGGAAEAGGSDQPVSANETEEEQTGTTRLADQNDPKPSTGPVQDKTVERSVYLLKLDNTGTIFWTKVKRNLPASDRPLQDALEVLIRGPLAEEEKQGLISLIPKDVKIQSAVVRGNTAYVSFSEDFLFNIYGVEGYVGQRRQIVLTATEFSNVQDIQILIDGKRVDYLGEGVWIGSPISRNML